MHTYMYLYNVLHKCLNGIDHIITFCKAVISFSSLPPVLLSCPPPQIRQTLPLMDMFYCML